MVMEKQQNIAFMLRITKPNNYGGYRGGSPTAVQAWQPCPLWEPSPSHPILV